MPNTNTTTVTISQSFLRAVQKICITYYIRSSFSFWSLNFSCFVGGRHKKRWEKNTKMSSTGLIEEKEKKKKKKE